MDSFTQVLLAILKDRQENPRKDRTAEELLFAEKLAEIDRETVAEGKLPGKSLFEATTPEELEAACERLAKALANILTDPQSMLDDSGNND